MHTPFSLSEPRAVAMMRQPSSANRMPTQSSAAPFRGAASSPQANMNTPSIFRSDVLSRLRVPILRYHE